MRLPVKPPGCAPALEDGHARSLSSGADRDPPATGGGDVSARAFLVPKAGGAVSGSPERSTNAISAISATSARLK
jgi:hypothetical protein